MPRNRFGGRIGIKQGGFNQKGLIQKMIEEISHISLINISAVVAVLILTFGAIFSNRMDRTVCVVLGAASMLIAGSLLGFYDQLKAFESIQMSPILIFISMSIFSLLLEQLHFFDYVAKKMIIRTKGETVKIVCMLCFMTYAASLLVNNLTTILIIVPITLYISRGLSINPVPIAIAEIIASNIGGASTMIGDFPNMLIASTTDLMFMDFMIYMFPVCFILFLCLIWFVKRSGFCRITGDRASILDTTFIKTIEEEVRNLNVDWPAVKRVIFVLAGLIAAFNVLPFIGIKPATIALAGGFFALAMERKHVKNVLKKVSFSDIMFFTSLFIIVGAAFHCGLLKIISDGITNMAMGNRAVYLLLLMWTAAIVTAFLNAGPATAFFVPVAMQSYFIACGSISWWALSLGVLAGSSATITGATAGIVTQTLFEENAASSTNGKSTGLLTFGNYGKKGIPIAIIFLAVSSIYIVFLCAVGGPRQ